MQGVVPCLFSWSPAVPLAFCVWTCFPMLCDFLLFVAAVPLRHQQGSTLVTQPVIVGTDSELKIRLCDCSLTSAPDLFVTSPVCLFLSDDLFTFIPPPCLRGAAKCETSTVLLILWTSQSVMTRIKRELSPAVIVFSVSSWLCTSFCGKPRAVLQPAHCKCNTQFWLLFADSQLWTTCLTAHKRQKQMYSVDDICLVWSSCVHFFFLKSVLFNITDVLKTGRTECWQIVMEIVMEIFQRANIDCGGNAHTHTHLQCRAQAAITLFPFHPTVSLL